MSVVKLKEVCYTFSILHFDTFITNRDRLNLFREGRFKEALSHTDGKSESVTGVKEVNMPFDSFGSNLESDISKLQAQKEALEYIMDTCQMYYAVPENKAKVLRELARDLARQKEWKEWQLRGHRERDKELGIKY